MASVSHAESSGDLEGVEFSRVCDEGSKFYAVASLKKSNYFRALRKKLTTTEKAMKQLVTEYRSSGEGHKIRLASEMRKLDKAKGEDYQGNLTICQSFQKV